MINPALEANGDTTLEDLFTRLDSNTCSCRGLSHAFYGNCVRRAWSRAISNWLSSGAHRSRRAGSCRVLMVPTQANNEKEKKQKMMEVDNK